jgi:hypothetical protein
MAFPLLLGLGILAGNELFRQQRVKTREEETASQYRGLLGQAGGNVMGPPTEAGEMGYRQGTGLLADPSNVGNQLQFAAGIAGLPGQQAAGLNMLNAAMQRAQSSEQAKIGQNQWQQQFDRQTGRDALADTRYATEWDANRADQAERARLANQAAGLDQSRFGLEQGRYGLAERQFGLGQNQWQQEFDLRKRAQDRLDKLADAKVDGPDLPKLPVGYGWQPDGQGGMVAAPAKGTPDWSKGVAGLQSLTAADKNIGTLVDMLSGVERVTPGGVKVRSGGLGTEMFGENAGKYSALRAAVIADVAKLRDMGVLQAGELERLEEQLPDPSSKWGPLQQNSKTKKSYEELRQQFRAKRDSHVQANPWLLPPVPPGFKVQQ